MECRTKYPNFIERKELRDNGQESLAERLKIYPSDIEKGLANWVRDLGFDADEIHSSNSVAYRYREYFPQKT